MEHEKVTLAYQKQAETIQQSANAIEEKQEKDNELISLTQLLEAQKEECKVRKWNKEGMNQMQKNDIQLF